MQQPIAAVPQTPAEQVVWGGYSFNASSEQAAKQFVADLYEHLSRGGNVSVHVEALDGTEYSLEATARR